MEYTREPRVICALFHGQPTTMNHMYCGAHTVYCREVLEYRYPDTHTKKDRRRRVLVGVVVACVHACEIGLG